MIPLCRAEELAEGRGRGFQIGAAAIVALRFRDRIYVYRNSCPHLGIELNWRADEFFDRDGERLQCATHGALFEPDSGRCIAGPCRGRALQPVAWRIDGGHVYVQP